MNKNNEDRKRIPMFVSLYDLLLINCLVEVEDCEYIGRDISRIIDLDNGQIINREQFSNLLYKSGIDLDKGYRITEKVQHRGADNKVVLAHRIEGEERMDTKWIQSGHASEEAFFTSSKYPDMRNIHAVMQESR